MKLRLGLLLPAVVSCLAMRCGSEDPVGYDYGGLMADSIVVRGPKLSDSSDPRTAVWEVRNQWEDRATPEALEAGPGWNANSGLNWDEKYSAWIASMDVAAASAQQTQYRTFLLTTPFRDSDGNYRSIEGPKMDCADLALFLRVAFASWYGLPLFFVGTEKGNGAYFGHFGARTKAGPLSGYAQYGSTYRDVDFSDPNAPLAARTEWPSDSRLRAKRLGKATDTTGLGTPDNDSMPFLGSPDLGTGAYLDAILLNKRVGHFLMDLFGALGSQNLADSRNAYHLVPTAMHPGDVVVERWESEGIGHTAVVKEVEPFRESELRAEVMYGSIPKQQPMWIGPVESEIYLFTEPRTGGEGVSDDDPPRPYYELGGGLKRLRVAKPDSSGYWIATPMASDLSFLIPDTDYERIKSRPEQFRTLLGEVDDNERLRAALSLIESKRDHLKDHPASCAARTAREKAFEEVYALNAKIGRNRDAVDSLYRAKDDYIFPELDYGNSKTCCWNSTTHEMFEIVTAYTDAREAEAQACLPPDPFVAVDGGYERFRAFAEKMGKADIWREWSEDEACPQRDVQNDAILPSSIEAFCDLPENTQKWSWTQDG